MYPPGASNISYVQNCNCVLWKLLLFSESLHKEKLVLGSLVYKVLDVVIHTWQENYDKDGQSILLG